MRSFFLSLVLGLATLGIFTIPASADAHPVACQSVPRPVVACRPAPRPVVACRPAPYHNHHVAYHHDWHNHYYHHCR
jgi:hypothetical protein